MLQEINPGYAVDNEPYTSETQHRNQTVSERELQLVKAQADMLATELAQEKARLDRFNQHICQKCDECEELESIVSYLMSEERSLDTTKINLRDKRLMLIGGSPTYGKVIEYFVSSLGGRIDLISSNISAEELSELDKNISEVDMVMFQSNTFSELELWNTARAMCDKYGTKFTILGKATISCFTNRVYAAF